MHRRPPPLRLISCLWISYGIWFIPMNLFGKFWMGIFDWLASDWIPKTVLKSYNFYYLKVRDSRNLSILIGKMIWMISILNQVVFVSLLKWSVVPGVEVLNYQILNLILISISSHSSATPPVACRDTDSTSAYVLITCSGVCYLEIYFNSRHILAFFRPDSTPFDPIFGATFDFWQIL